MISNYPIPNNTNLAPQNTFRGTTEIHAGSLVFTQRGSCENIIVHNPGTMVVKADLTIEGLSGNGTIQVDNGVFLTINQFSSFTGKLIGNGIINIGFNVVLRVDDSLFTGTFIGAGRVESLLLVRARALVDVFLEKKFRVAQAIETTMLTLQFDHSKEIKETTRSSIAAYAKTKQLGLDLYPPTCSPLPDIPSQVKNDFVRQFKEEFRPAIRLIVDNIRYISYDEFQVELKICINKYSEILKKSPKKKTAVLIDKGHSQFWVANHALTLLDHNQLPDVSIENPSKENRFFRDMVIPKDIQRIVIFDDWSISGAQIQEIMNSIERATAEKNLEVIFIVPFITNYAKEKLSRVMTVVSSSTLVALSEIPQLAETIAPLDQYFQNFMRGDAKTLVYSDWKTPDAMSIPFFIVDGFPPFSMLNEGTQRQAIPVIPPVEPPYREKKSKYYKS